MDFSEKNLEAAITAIQEGMSRRDAEKLFGVPKTTLGRRLKGASNKPGRPPVLTTEEEKVIHYSHLSRDFSSAAMMDHNLTVDTHSNQLLLLHVVTAECELLS